MYDVKIDKDRNRIYILLKGFMSSEEIKEAVDLVKENVKHLQPGFDDITDISDFRPATTEGTLQIKNAQEFLSNAGMRSVVRIVKSSITSSQFKRLAREAHVKYHVFEAGSIEEAEKFLNNLNGEN